MSTDAALGDLIRNRLVDDDTVAGLVDGRIYNVVPQGATFPYISFGPSDAVQAGGDCLAAIVHRQKSLMFRDYAGTCRDEVGQIPVFRGVGEVRIGFWCGIATDKSF